ncbi:peroxisome assembly protein 12-like isoform X2 [Prorops nasuta]|uniref:peroxisome assembly protein 12-like isoform X2 n=1 Tax=Prorops nasuta TaxID=863751 RepID=UPI0034CE12B9
MAEKGAHLTATAFAKPSIFEIIAQESLASTLEPAFKKVFFFLASCNLDRYGHLLKWSNEAFLVFNIFVQRYYLNKYSASFSEAFYSLKRSPLVKNEFQNCFTNKQKRLSFLFLVLFPYVKSKLSDLCQQYQLEEADGQIPRNKWSKILRACIIKGYTIGFTFYESIVLLNLILYASGWSNYPMPIYNLLSVTLVYSTMQAPISIYDILRKVKTNTFGINDGLDVLERVATRSLELSAFLLQFAHWWHQENLHTNLMSLPVPPSPKIPEEAKKYKGLCPICMKKRRISTALMVSGYVFCYPCILPIIKKNKKCPVTNYPAIEEDLIRLYID